MKKPTLSRSKQPAKTEVQVRRENRKPQMMTPEQAAEEEDPSQCREFSQSLEGVTRSLRLAGKSAFNDWHQSQNADTLHYLLDIRLRRTGASERFTTSVRFGRGALGSIYMRDSTDDSLVSFF